MSALEAVDAVCRRWGIDLAVLFGSVARGRLRADSDVDIAVRFTQGRPAFVVQAAVVAELHDALRPPREVDLVLLNLATPLLLIQVGEEGVPLFEASEVVWPQFRICGPATDLSAIAQRG